MIPAPGSSLRTTLLFVFFFLATVSSAQERPELNVGLRTGFGPLQYAIGSYTIGTTWHMQPNMRYHLPIKTFTTRGRDNYLTIVGGLGYTKVISREAEEFRNGGRVKVDPPQLNYIPLTLGLYGGGALGVGIEASYWKGVGNGDQFSMKLFSLLLNVGQFKVGGGFEISTCVPAQETPSSIGSLELYYRLPRRE